MTEGDLIAAVLADLRMRSIESAIDLQKLIPKGFLNITATAADFMKFVLSGEFKDNAGAERKS
jgi:hypothetical protein